ncbi:P2Y purinoceptor 8-like [Colossoma macropomum]|uniref:P2Y purinoceptor 8-like n=1 Tax=Colossoma macropomum TaxID=42526 RepID=UPI00186457E2|nr:P2Y purinoceptor 8-like [Colossoma macropomum]
MNNSSQSIDNATLDALVSPLMTVALPIIYIMVFVISTPCNLIALILLCGLTKRATPTIIYSINLCLADLLYSITLPLQVCYHLQRNDWIFGKVSCGISTAAFYCNMTCSIFTTCAIALERYCGVVHPLKTKHLRSTRKAILICLLIWAVMLVFQMPYFVHDFTRFIPQLNVTTCFDVIPKKVFEGWKGYLYFVSIYLFFNVLPMIILVACYCAVARALRQTLDAGVQRSHKRTQTLVIVAALCYITCYLPNMIVQPIHMVYRSKNHGIYAYYKLTLGLNSFNCCFDPFVYYLASRELRQALWRVLGRWNCCPSNMGEETVASNLSELPSATRGNQNDSRALISQ